MLLPCDQPGQLMAWTRGRLQGQDLLAIHVQSRLPYFWLKKYAAGEIKNPSVNRVEALYVFFSGKFLTLEK